MPYIPNDHKKYKLLPNARKIKREVFEYPSELLDQVNSILPKDEGMMPYGYKSYDEYFGELEKWLDHFSGDAIKKDLLDRFYNKMVALNHKETWAVLRYVGETTDELFGLTHGKYYYCPRPTSVHETFGVIDDEEFTSYMYSCDPSLWILYEDPTGEASEVLKQIPKKDRMCPCCGKHYFFVDGYEVCPICGWKIDDGQKKNPNDSTGANRLSLTECKNAIEIAHIDLSDIVHKAFEDLPPSFVNFICEEFVISKSDLFGATERQLDCAYNTLEMLRFREYYDSGRRTERYKILDQIVRSIEKYYRTEITSKIWGYNEFSPLDVIKAHRYANNHKSELEIEQKCGCFCCEEIFSSSEIKEWLVHNNPCDKLGTAICPKCDIDSVIGESSGYPITSEFLKEMKDYWFGDID